jgi:photosystem II stability/assembly factor-like uncharacterized protein
MLARILRLLLTGILLALTAQAQAPPPPSQAPPPVSTAKEAQPPRTVLPVLESVALKGLKPRSIGPAIMGGRVSDIAFDPKNPYAFYYGLATGGLIKTSDNGASFEAIFARQAVASIGAVAVAPSDANVVWVGTGEADDRNSASWGDGVYRSTDGGATWTNVGLRDSKSIARVVVHPADPQTAWVAVMGDLWNFRGRRGLYKTTDAGVNWKLVLSAPAPYTDRAGCVDVALDPSDPNTLYAALYARRRTPWSFVSGPDATDEKDVGGIFKSADGGATWRKLEKGLPGKLGRIGLTVGVKNPRVVYAVVQSYAGGTGGIEELTSKSGGVFRSDDGGEAWTRTNALDPLPFYFSQIRVDPGNDKRVYVLGFVLHVSEDGGHTFREDLFDKVHPDCHALAIDPRDPARLLIGTDGGIYQSFDRGKGWDHLDRVAAGEYYRINYDLPPADQTTMPGARFPSAYRICGGLQDNMNWAGPNRTRSKDGILNSDWINLDGGDGFYCVFDPSNRDIVYTESQQGSAFRMDLSNGESKRLRPQPGEGEPAFRFHWNAPLIGSRHAPGTLYLAGNHVFRLTDRGEHWQRISPDLSTQNPKRIMAVGSGAENYGVVYALAESPLKAGLLWAGTDDGKLWVTENDGANWTDLSAGLPAPAKEQWIFRIEPGQFDADVAYLVVLGYPSGNYAPLAWRTANRGKTWESIVSNLPPAGPLKVVRQDPKNREVLYAGTEFGLFVSINQGGHWTKFPDLPTVAVDDIQIQPQQDDLLIATHGRSIFIVDDLRPLQRLSAAVFAKAAYLFPPRPAFGTNLLPGFPLWNGKGVYRGENPPEGALLSFYVKAYTGEQVKITINDPTGAPVAKLTAPGTPGLSRISWDLKPTKEVLSEYRSEGQKFVKPGEYTVDFRYGDLKQTEKLQVQIAPGIETR